MQIKKTWQRAAMRRAALRYAHRLWPVMPGAYLRQGRYVCGPLCPTVACHPALDRWERDASCDPCDVAQWWADEPFSVLFVTGGAFDAIEVSNRLGLLVHPAITGPVIVSPTGRWLFLVAAGDGLRPELDAQLDIVLHGRGSWIPAPPTSTPEGRIRWARSPESTGWTLPASYAVQAQIVRHLPALGSAPTFSARAGGFLRAA